jgi:hypothetical protein
VNQCAEPLRRETKARARTGPTDIESGKVLMWPGWSGTELLSPVRQKGRFEIPSEQALRPVIQPYERCRELSTISRLHTLKQTREGDPMISLPPDPQIRSHRDSDALTRTRRCSCFAGCAGH